MSAWSSGNQSNFKKFGPDVPRGLSTTPMALFSDDLFNIFDEEADPPSSKSKKRRREGKGSNESGTKETEKPKKPKLGEQDTTGEPGVGQDEVGTGQGALEHVIHGPEEAEGDALDEQQEEYVKTEGWMTVHLVSHSQPLTQATHISLGDPAPHVKRRVWYRRCSDFVCLAVHIATQSDSSFVKRHEKITSMVWSDQSDSRFTAGSLSLIGCLCRHSTTSAFQIDRSTTASVPDSNFPVESLATRDYTHMCCSIQLTINTHTRIHTHTRILTHTHTHTHTHMHTHTFTHAHAYSHRQEPPKTIKVPLFSEPAKIIAVQTLEGLACTHEVGVALLADTPHAVRSCGPEAH